MWPIFSFILLLASFGANTAQRKISRRVAVGAEVKTGVNFDCPEEFGYYPHPTDCTQYYVCVFGGALLESCTGGLMYSHELQTCDWPRNVGCDGSEVSGPPSATAASSSSGRNREREEPRSRYTAPPPPPPPAQPSAVVTSRGQPRQLQHTQREIIKQQQQLYADAEETLPPAEEIESDRQQRVYRGQPSTVGQVQRDRDGLRHSNAIPTYSDRSEKIGVISFGIQQQQPAQQHYNEMTDKLLTNDKTTFTRHKRQLYKSEEISVTSSPQPSVSTATPRALFNSSQYTNQYDPYYALYDDDVELYKDVDYSHNNNFNSNNQEGAQRAQPPIYRGTPAPAIQPTATAQEGSPKRGNTVYIQNNFNPQDIYQQSTAADYSDENNYNQQGDEHSSFRQSNRQPSRLSLRGDRNELNELEEATTKRITTTTRKPITTTSRTTITTTTRYTTTTTSRTILPKKNTPPSSHEPVTPKENQTQAQIFYLLPEDPRHTPQKLSPPSLNKPEINSNSSPDIQTTKETPMTYRPKYSDIIPDFSLHEPVRAAVIKRPAPFSLPKQLTTEKPAFHYITKSSKSTDHVSEEERNEKNVLVTTSNPLHLSIVRKTKIIIPTTYSPPKFFLKSILPKPLTTSSFNLNKTDHVATKDTNKTLKTLKSVRKFLNPIILNHELSTPSGARIYSTENIIPEIGSETTENLQSSRISTTLEPVNTDKETPSYRNADEINYIKNKLESHFQYSKFKHLIESEPNNSTALNEKRFRNTVEIPPPHVLSDFDDEPKQEPDLPPLYKPQPYPKPHIATRTDAPLNISLPTRVSRVNAAIKSLIAIGAARRPSSKCIETANSKCNESKQRTSSRGRGSAHYSGSAGIANNEVSINTNRGTPASRSRPTLKPSTSIVSKAQEFIDIYRFPPRRPDAIYPQPQPDKTAAKCRKDVCLLPDCSCGGKEIPGDLPVDQVPQIVLLTYDDSVNDLNKGLYSDLFEKGRTNPNGCPIAATFYVSHEWTDYSQVQNLYSDGHEIASHTVSHSFGEQFSQKKWTREVAGQREILSAYGGVRLEDVRGMRAPFLSVGGNKMFKMLYDSNFTYDSSMPIYENKPPSWPYTLDYKLFHDCMIPPCPTRSYPGVWEVPMVMWQDLNGGRCSMGDACSNPPDAEGVFKMLMKNFQRHYTTNRAPFGLFYHAAWFTQPHHKEGFIKFIDTILAMKDVWMVTNWQAIQWVRDPTPTSRLGSFQPFQCDFSDRPKRCNNPKVCNLWHKSGVRYMRTCQPCPDIYPWTGNTGIRSSRIDNDIED